jgi:hypothetical protein
MRAYAVCVEADGSTILDYLPLARMHACMALAARVAHVGEECSHHVSGCSGVKSRDYALGLISQARVKLGCNLYLHHMPIMYLKLHWGFFPT